MREPRKLIRWVNPALSPDEKEVWVEIEVEGNERADLAVPISEIGDTVAFFASLADYVAKHREENEDDPINLGPQEYVPIEVVGLGLVTGRNQDETILLVRLAGFSIGLSLSSSKVAQIGRDFAQMAELLSASGKPQ